MFIITALQDSLQLASAHAGDVSGHVTGSASGHGGWPHGPGVILANNIPDGAADAPDAVKTKVNTIVGLFKYGGLGAAVIGVITLAISLMLASKGRGGGEDHGKAALVLGIGMVVLGSASALVGFLV